MTVTANYRPSMQVPVEPSVLPVFVTAASTEILVDVPWKNCRCTGCTLSLNVANGAAATGTIDLELNAASGSIMYTVTIGNSQAVGTTLTGVASVVAASKNLDRGVTARDQINIAVTVGSSTNWTGMLYIYFEPMI